MTLQRLAFEQVVDGRTNYATRAIVRLDIERFAHETGYRLEGGVDGLDGYLAIPLEFIAQASPRRSAYSGSPSSLTRDQGSLPPEFQGSVSVVVDPVRFALWRHAGNPAGQTAIYLPIEQPWQRDVELIVPELGLRKSDVVRLDTSALPKGR